MRTNLLRVAGPAGVVVVMIAGLSLLVRSRSQAAETSYFTAPTETGAVKALVNATGVVQTALTVQVGSQVSGQVQELYADFNSVVKRGQLLAKLDTRNLEAQVANARAAVASARARIRSAEADVSGHSANLHSARANVDALRATRDYARLQHGRAVELREKGLTSVNDLDNAKANSDTADAKYEQALAAVTQLEAQKAAVEAQIAQATAGLQQAEAELSRASVNLEYANIFSPVDGVVISRDVDVGQTIAAAMQAPTLFSIATDLKQMQVKASVDEADIGTLAEGGPVAFTVDAYPNDHFSGSIAEIRLSPQTVQNVVTYNVIVSIDNADLKLKPGMTANLTMTVAERARVLKVPNAALRYTPPNAPHTSDTSLVPTSDAVGAPVESPLKDDPTPAIPRAPGQKWNSADKLRFVARDQMPTHGATVWTLSTDGRPSRHAIVVGITDGVSTEVVRGDLAAALVIVGDSTQVDAVNQAAPRLTLGGGQRSGR